MPPLTRQDTRTSVFSWWSNSNPLLNGPTVNLHAAAKPLMKWMHHRQALEIIRQNQGSPLSTATLDTYWSYFPWDYVAWETKVAILKELSREVDSENCVRLVVDSTGFSYIGEMLGSPDAVAQSSSCILLERLARYEFAIPYIVEIRGCERLVAFLDHQNNRVVWEATYALAMIARWSEGAQAMVDAKVQDHILKLLKSQNVAVVGKICHLMAQLAGHELTAPAVLQLNLLKQLVVLAGSHFWSAIDALRAISQWPDGVAALADIDVFEELQHLDHNHLPELRGNITLLLDAVLKHTPDDSPDLVSLPQLVPRVQNLAQLGSQLVFKPGDEVDLRLQEEGRELVYKGVLNKRDGELQVYLFDHALLFAKPLKTKTDELFKVYRRPIPLELLLISASEEVANRNSQDTHAPRGSPHPAAVNIRPDPKGPHWITFTYLGRRTYSLALWANSTLAQRKWVEQITKRQTAMRERSTVFDTIALSEGFFSANKVNCAAPFSGGRRIVYGTDDGVFISDLQDISKDPVKVLALLDVSQVDVLEDYQLLIVLSERQVLTFPLDALDPMDPTAGLMRAKRIATHISLFKTGVCLGRVLVCVVKAVQGSSTFKVLEPIEPNVRGRAKPTFKKLLQGGNDTLKPFRELYLPVESTSVHYLKTRMCIGSSKGFDIVDLETLETLGLLDPADESLEFVRTRENLRPMAIYRINNDFLLCYDEFAFYVDKTGRRSRKEFLVFWEGTPTGFALHEPYVLAFEPSFVEIRHIETGLVSQVILGSNLRLLFADTPPSMNNSGGGYNYQGGFDPSSQPNSAGSAFSQNALSPHMRHPDPQGVERDHILMVSDDRVLALRPAAGAQRFMSDNP